MEDKPEPFERDYKEHLSMNEEALPAFGDPAVGHVAYNSLRIPIFACQNASGQ
jgi:hypothetical protein